MSFPVPQLPPTIVAIINARIKVFYASCFVGFTVATTLFGISVLQCYFYFRNYPKDSFFLKLTVASLWLLDFISTMMSAQSLYTYYVLYFGGDIEDSRIPWSFGLENLLIVCITIIAQCFYAFQLWTVSRNKTLIGGIVFPISLLHLGVAPNISSKLFLAVSSFGIGIYITIHIFQYKSVSEISQFKTLVPNGFVQGLAAGCDILITLALVFYLRKEKQERSISSSERIINKLVLYIVCRGTLTA
ncbi:hypothetical protein BDZ94DRAFT_1308100 [Collybia nuda]|uniref:DUF6534 domain-containing protein n=1 Tax=Collybia nuda TaxID=64659 RepID=A0A9P6CKX9_9AGAR|nr:hypothetical protein BDZ94DRAFT_1308100 [Collybia nuda]